MPRIVRACDKPITAKEIFQNIERLENRLQGEILEYEVRKMRVEFRKQGRLKQRQTERAIA